MPADNPYADLPRVDTTPLDTPTGEGIYWMADKSGKQKGVPYSNVRRAVKTGWTLRPGSAEKFSKDISADTDAATKFFPELKLAQRNDLLKGVRITGINSAGQPIFGAMDQPGPQGSATHRFTSSFWQPITGTMKGTYHAFADAPRDAGEAEYESKWRRLSLGTKRMLYDPSAAEGQKVKDEAGQANWMSVKPEDVSHQALAIGHTLGMIPLVGPAAAQIGEKLGTQLGTGDYAGAAGTVAGNVALEEAPKLGGKVLRSKMVTESLPMKMVNQLIRPSAADLRFGKDPAGAILDEKIVGNNLEQLGKRTNDRLHQVGAAIDTKAKAVPAGTDVDVSKVLDPIDAAMIKAAKAGDKSLYDRLLSVRTELEYNWKPKHTDAQGNVVKQPVPGGTTVLEPAGKRTMTMSPYDAVQFKRAVGDRIRWTQDPLDDEVNAALGSGYGIVKDAINQKVPGLKDLNERYSNLVGAAKAIERRIPVDARKAHWSLSDIVLGTAVLPLAIAGKVVQLPRVRTRAARFLANTLPKLPAPGIGIRAPAAVAAQIGSYGQQKKPVEDTNGAPLAAPAEPDNPYADLPRVASGPGTGSSAFATAISNKEGFGTPDTIPTRAKNPGALELGDIGYGTLTAAGGQQITIFPSEQAGWDALGRQLNLILTGGSARYSPDTTLEEFGRIYSNGDRTYGAQIAAALGVDPSITLGELAQSQSPAATTATGQ